jgi:hypothetical protein
MKKITREEIKNILEKWQSGILSNKEVEKFTFSYISSDDIETEDEVVATILGYLDNLDINNITKSDAPFFIGLLNKDIQTAQEVEEKFNQYIK